MSDVLVLRDGAVVQISLNRPDRLNAFNGSMRANLIEALTAAASDPSCRAVILRGEGRGFSAGQDLADMTDGDDLGQLLQTGYAPIVRTIRTMPKPVLCAVQGVAAGAGANLALTCDIVMAAESARFIQAFIHIGLLPDVGGTWILPRLVGLARARAICMTGAPVGAAQAESWGMIHRAIPDDRLLDETTTMARALAGAPTQAIGLMKRAFEAAETNDFDQQLAVENALQSELGRSADFAEGKRAFLEKRPARFTG